MRSIEYCLEQTRLVEVSSTSCGQRVIISACVFQLKVDFLIPVDKLDAVKEVDFSFNNSVRMAILGSVVTGLVASFAKSCQDLKVIRDTESLLKFAVEGRLYYSINACLHRSYSFGNGYMTNEWRPPPGMSGANCLVRNCGCGAAYQKCEAS